MSSYYTPWTWSEAHQRHYSYLMSADHSIIDTIWSGPPGAADTSASRNNGPPSSSHPHGAPQHGHPPAPSAPPSQPTSSTPGAFENSVNNQDSEGDRVDSPTQPHRQGGRPRLPSSSAPPLYTGNTSNQPGTVPFGSGALGTSPPTSRATVASLPPDVQAHIGYLNRRFIQTGPDVNVAETLDARYRRVAVPHQQFFFVPGRVFKMLWTEPAGQANPGQTRNSTHFSTVRFGEQAYTEIRRFVVVRNKGTFSQCIPVQTYKGRGATKPNIVMQDHGIIHTSLQAPSLIPGENLTKYSIRVQPTANEVLEPASRINYGKAYAVEHNVKVLDIGMVVEGHRYLIESYFESAMRGA